MAHDVTDGMAVRQWQAAVVSGVWRTTDGQLRGLSLPTGDNDYLTIFSVTVKARWSVRGMWCLLLWMEP